MYTPLPFIEQATSQKLSLYSSSERDILEHADFLMRLKDQARFLSLAAAADSIANCVLGSYFFGYDPIKPAIFAAITGCVYVGCYSLLPKASQDAETMMEEARKRPPLSAGTNALYFTSSKEVIQGKKNLLKSL